MIDVDPTVERLQRVIAERLGHEAAIYAVRHDDESVTCVRIADPETNFYAKSDVISSTSNRGFAQLSGLVARTIPTETVLLQLSDAVAHPTSQ